MAYQNYSIGSDFEFFDEMENDTMGFDDDNGTKFDNVTYNRYGRVKLRTISMDIQIAFYSVIFLLAVVGNILVIVTLIQNKRMRTVTNVFLLSLAISDLLLAVFCMPFTLVPVLLRNFIFGAVMCVLIRYLQAVSVGASCFTLVAISMERYYAICQPLHSRSWQTLSHSYRSIAVCWALSAVIMTPIAVFQSHRRLPSGAHSCREKWPDSNWEKAYSVFLDLALLVVPVLIMTIGYGCVIRNLARDVRTDCNMTMFTNGSEVSRQRFVMPSYRTLELKLFKDSFRSVSSASSTEEGTPPIMKRSRRVHRIRHTNPEKIRQNKVRVIKMLFVVVLEFFICWTPVYVVQTWMIFDFSSASKHVTPLIKTFFHLLSYFSSCCNPITYCFMNKKFREAFVRVFQCKSPTPPLKDRRRNTGQLRLDSRRSEAFNPNSSTSTKNSSIRQVDYDPIHGADDFNDN
ncbi:cholecystokinin receptor type A-like [Patella vulgata]|uniref:cholecystokinin receptor type A-like n=1 Tax=Patella vulgata TaxID=6465 RepID=UPI00217FFDD8|nr:cholecystokinin receptor type A-like [Patella vulgata]